MLSAYDLHIRLRIHIQKLYNYITSVEPVPTISILFHVSSIICIEFQNRVKVYVAGEKMQG